MMPYDPGPRRKDARQARKGTPARRPARYMLIRVTPAGEEKHQGPVSTSRAAATLAAGVLHDNAGVSRRDAQRFAARLHAASLGTTVRDEPTNYRFCIMTDEEQ